MISFIIFIFGIITVITTNELTDENISNNLENIENSLIGPVNKRNEISEYATIHNTQLSFFPDYIGTTSISQDEAFKRTSSCIHWYAGYDHSQTDAQNIALSIYKNMGSHITSSVYPNAHCGSCIRVSANNKVFYVTVIDMSHGNSFRLHPEIFFRMFGGNKSYPTESYWLTDEIRERYRGMSTGAQAVQIQFADPRNCPGYPSNLYDKWVYQDRLPAGQTDGEVVDGDGLNAFPSAANVTHYSRLFFFMIFITYKLI
eukprot:GHVL01026817.1.p1 GENE.GHVL01026817.1~~GHVL01026817.1.p1  ORF type:complete len:291 (+),score=50.41 GHVL01026817.1:102-875(+)